MMLELLIFFWVTRDTLPPDLPEGSRAAVLPSLMRVNLALQLVGPHEGYGANITTELHYSHRAYGEVGEAPRLEVLDLFPSLAYATARLRLYGAEAAWLEDRCVLASWHAEACKEGADRVRARAEPWRLLQEAATKSWSWQNRRRCLQRLRCEYPAFYYGPDR